jgi:WD40 repeat protein
MLALVAAVILSPKWLPQFPDPPALLTRIGSPAFRYAFGGTLRAVSPDGKKLYTAKHWGCSGGVHLTNIYVWDALTGKLLNSYKPPSISRYYFASDGLRVIADWREEDGFALGKYRFQLLDPDTGRVIREGKPWDEPPTKALGFSDILHFVSEMTTATWDVHNTGRELALLNAETGKLVSFNPAVPIEGASISVASNGLMALVSVEKQFRLYDLPEGKLRKEWLDTDQRQTVGFSADGKSLVGWKRLKAGWSLEVEELNGQTRTILEGQREPGSVKFAPNGEVFILRDWEIHDTAIGKLLGTVPSSEQGSQVFFSPDGRTLWTKVGHGTLVPWDVASGQLARNAPDPPGPVERMRFAAEDKLVGLSGGFVITWDPTTGKELSRVRVPGSINWQIGATFTPAGDRLVYADSEGQTVGWNFLSGAETRVSLTPHAKPDSTVDRVLTPEGSFVISRHGKTLRFHTTTDNKKVLERPVPEINGVWEWLDETSAFFDVSADGRRLAVVGRAWGPRSAAIIDLTSPKTADVTVHLEHLVRSIAMSPDARFFAAAGEDSVEKENPVLLLTVWNAATGRKVAELPLPSETAWALSFSPDGRTLAAVADEKVILVDMTTWKVKARLRGRTRIDSFWLDNRNMLAWSPSGRLLAVQTADERLAIWDMTKLEGK